MRSARAWPSAASGPAMSRASAASEASRLAKTRATARERGDGDVARPPVEERRHARAAWRPALEISALDAPGDVGGGLTGRSRQWLHDVLSGTARAIGVRATARSLARSVDDDDRERG